MDAHKDHLKDHYRSLAQKLISGQMTADQFAEELATIHLSLEQLSWQDNLVEGFLNNTGFTKALEVELELLKRIDRLQGVLLALDIDRLKKFNDSMGHVAGDRLIKTYGQVMTINTRAADLKGRLGGDEFGIFLTGSNIDNAKIVAERIRTDIISTVKEAFLEWPEEQTVSIGIAELREEDSVQTLREKADKALYEAKKTRNSTSVHTLPS